VILYNFLAATVIIKSLKLPLNKKFKGNLGEERVPDWPNLALPVLKRLASFSFFKSSLFLSVAKN
jgi:hypothetical protein